MRLTISGAVQLGENVPPLYGPENGFKFSLPWFLLLPLCRGQSKGIIGVG
jgi:hypothetical protein